MPTSYARRWILLGCAFLVLLAFGLNADPLYTYTYTGNLLDAVAQNPIGGDYPDFSASDYITATITLDVQVSSEDDVTDYTPDIVSYVITAGPLTMTNENSDLNLAFGTTDGEITQWFMDATQTPPEVPEDWLQAAIETVNQIGFNPESDYANVGNCGEQNGCNEAYNFDPAGWSESSESSVPEPATITMLMGGLALLGRKRVRNRLGIGA